MIGKLGNYGYIQICVKHLEKMLTNILNYSSGLFTTKIMLVYIKYHMFNLCQLCRQLHTIFIRNVFINTINEYIIPCLLQCSHTTAYDISVCQRMVIRSHTQIYLRCTLGMRRVHVRSQYSDMLKNVANAGVQHIRYSYNGRSTFACHANYAGYTLLMLLIRVHALCMRYSYTYIRYAYVDKRYTDGLSSKARVYTLKSCAYTQFVRYFIMQFIPQCGCTFILEVQQHIIIHKE